MVAGGLRCLFFEARRAFGLRMDLPVTLSQAKLKVSRRPICRSVQVRV